MIFNKNKHSGDSGFTIVELVIVIVVILILTVLIVSTYGGIKAKRRDTQRQTAVQKIQTQLEAFFSQNGYYPSLSDMNSQKWLNTNMKGLDQGLLVDPANSTGSKQLADSPTAKYYSYQVTDSSGNSCETNDTNCAKYTVTATYEGTVNGSETYQKSNLD